MKKFQIAIFVLTIIATLEFIGLCSLQRNVKKHECEVDVILEPLQEEPTVEEKLQDLGEFRITAYCACEKCCGEWADNRPDGKVIGAAGIELKAGVSCASTLPFGTVLDIDGLGEYIVQDRTAKWVVDEYGENIIDIYFDDHEVAKKFGLQYHKVYLKGQV
jgi:3D (Asp-Asp-Asp) domain-containing protein